MFGFFEKKEDKNKKLDEAFLKVAEEIRAIEEWDDPKKIEHYILDSCEQIIGTTKEIEARKSEYRHLTSYLNDITKIEKLPPDKKAELVKVAGEMAELNKKRMSFEQENPRISEENFQLMAENEDDLPRTIKTMMENEVYQSNIAKNMKYLEGERDRLEIERDDHKRRKRKMRFFAIVLMASLATLLAVFFILKSYVEADTSWAMLSVILLISAVGTYLFVRLSKSSTGNRKALKKLNETIALLNSVRIRYANVTSAINYVQNKYNVRTAAELGYLWNSYGEEVRRQERFLENNKDLEYYTQRFSSVLDDLELYEKDVWYSRIKEILDPEEMKKFKHSLVEKRSKVREQIAENTKSVKAERDEIDRLMLERNYYEPEIMEIIASVDRLCGLNKTALEEYKKPNTKTKGKRRK
ncbi:MAG: hypothetical protein IIZ61_02710 [Lachnospiraceae bacterium]|nr:hypothetical protein [Lachnospiraceae bacterium]